MCAAITRYFFSSHPGSPLTSLKECINAPAVESNQKDIDKNHPIFEFLKSVPDEIIKVNTKKLGKNNLRNFNTMRSWLAKYFFDYDQNAPLECLKKFMLGEPGRSLINWRYCSRKSFVYVSSWSPSRCYRLVSSALTLLPGTTTIFIFLLLHKK